MHTNLASYFNLQQPYLPEDIADPGAFANLLKLSEALPPMASTVLEMRLNRPITDIDLSLCLDLDTPAYNFFLNGRHPSHHQHPLWLRLRALMAACASPGSLLRQSISKFWLEFDVSGPCDTLPIPGYYIDISNVDTKQLWQTAQKRPDYILQLAQQVHALTLDAEMPEAQSAYLKHCLTCLPENTVVAYLGNMIARGSCGTRFAVRGLQPAQAAKFLEQVNWRGDVDALLAGIDSIPEVAERVVFNFEADSELSDRIDIEFLVTPPNAATGWPLLLNRFVEKGYCSEEKFMALMQWPGYLTRSGQANWPMVMQQGSLFTSQRLQPYFHRAINHLKLIYRPAQPFEAKVYLSCQQMWLDVTPASR